MNRRYVTTSSVSLLSSMAMLLLASCAAAQPATPAATEPPPVVPASGAFSNDLSREAGSPYGMVFIIEKGNLEQIAGYMIFCGSPAGLSMPTLAGMSGTNVPIQDGKFTIDNENLLIEGHLTDSNTLEGTIQSKSDEATQCQIPENETWTATCGLPTGLVSLMIAGKSFSEEDLKGTCP